MTALARPAPATPQKPALNRPQVDAESRYLALFFAALDCAYRYVKLTDGTPGLVALASSAQSPAVCLLPAALLRLSAQRRSQQRTRDTAPTP